MVAGEAAGGATGIGGGFGGFAPNPILFTFFN